MSAKPLVSIIMPFKNTSRFLNETLSSVRKQTYPNWELLMVDDHSTDESQSIAKKHHREDSRIRVFSNSETGIIPALQTAYSHASGDMITRMDSDDVMPDTKLEYMVRHLQQYGRGHIALGQVKYFSEKGIGEGFRAYEKWLNRLTLHGTNFDELYKECVIPSPCWMTFRSDFEKCGGFEANRYPEDYDLVFRFFERGLKCIPSQHILHFWRDYPTRTSRTHENYADNTFLDLKLDYFLKLHYQKKRTLVVWGAGKKGKIIAKLLQKKKVEFYWVCDNPKKVGKEIYGKKMLSFGVIDDFAEAQNIIAVANPLAQEEIKTFFRRRGKLPMVDFFFFC